MITKEDIIGDKLPEYQSDYTATVQDNLIILTTRINEFEQLCPHTCSTRSGWRPEKYNLKVPNSSKVSKHIKGQALDLSDSERLIANWILQNVHVLKDLSLYMEDPRWTYHKGSDGVAEPWVHLQFIPPASGHYIYIPSSAPALDPDFWNGNYKI